MGFKSELQKELSNTKKDIDLSVTKVWNLRYEEHTIEIKHSLYEESLIIDGIERANKRRKSIWSHLVPMSKLQTSFQLQNGQRQKIVVKFSGLTRLNIHVKINRKTIFKDRIKIEFIAPWEGKESLFNIIEQQVAEHGAIIDSTLPDEQYLYDDELMITEPGLIDLIGNDELDPFQAKRLLKALSEQIKNPSVNTRRKTYEIIISDRIRTYFPQFIVALKKSDLVKERLYAESMWLLKHAAHREVIKVALILLSQYPMKEKDEDLVFTLAHHEEFTNYAILSLLRSQERLWQLANQLTGWGKVILMEELIPLTEERKLWFLKQRWDEPEKERATAILCAEKAEIDIILYETEIDSATFEQISRLMRVLISSSNEGFLIEDYDLGNFVLHHYIRQGKILGDTTLFSDIDKFLEDCDIWDEGEISALRGKLL